MNNIKIVTITLALMSTTAFADFTIKDLFTSGGTKTTQKYIENNDDTQGNHHNKTHK